MSKILTTYRGYYRTTRDSKKLGISFTYQICPNSGNMINEVETRVVEIN